jgi:hypothetical protein
MRVPPITVTCECGTRNAIPYGRTWTCETCGRRWDTSQIPEQEYRELERAVRRYQWQAVAFAALMLAIFAPLLVLVDIRLGITGLILFFFWAFYVRPRQRRRILNRVLSRAQWQLTPE